MNNTYFILSDKKVIIERLHICTWDFIGDDAAIEIGLEFSVIPSTPPAKECSFTISLPFLKKTDKIGCMMNTLVGNDNNSKFIFNDGIKASKPIQGDKRNGATIEFMTRNSISILPIKDIKTDAGICSFKVLNINHQVKNYIRMYVQTKLPFLSVIKSGITKTSYIYDIKINEKRNLPTPVNEKLNEGLFLCDQIKQCFCFHIIPSGYNISFVNNGDLKNIRILESEAFSGYLPNHQVIKKNKYIIVFNKRENSKDGAYSFFSEFEKESIGDKQIIFAIIVNMFCSLLLGISSLSPFEQGVKWYAKLPFLWWIAIVLFVILILLMFKPFHRLYHLLGRQKKMR